MTAKPQPTPVDSVPIGAPGPWTVFTHFLGGDDIAVQADPDTATRFVTDALAMDLGQECSCDWDCGPIYVHREGDSPDGSHLTRPVLVHDDLGLRHNGESRTDLYSAATVLTWANSPSGQASLSVSVPIPSP